MFSEQFKYPEDTVNFYFHHVQHSFFTYILNPDIGAGKE